MRSGIGATLLGDLNHSHMMRCGVASIFAWSMICLPLQIIARSVVTFESNGGTLRGFCPITAHQVLPFCHPALNFLGENAMPWFDHI